ncbi:hypothetical protein AX17_001376 [Amanita inopinata Kibby_2008]|nr:hypothetical protein AX17_001376 [Amanita inopinata Kibby_2008]
MPFVDLCSKDDYASIYYKTNSLFNNVSGFDPEKPSVLILHPLLLDSSWLNYHFDDARLYQNYNMIAFDTRTSGTSKCKASGSHDSWVEAADLAFCHQILQLPQCHILALESLSVNCALRFAVLFPEMCLSLTLCNIPAPTDARWVNAAYHELLQNWCFADDLETLEQAGVEAIKLILGNECNSDLQDELIAYWEVTVPPARRHRVLETLNVLLNQRTALDDDTLRSVTQPVLIIHGEKNEINPLKHAEHLKSRLVNVEGGAFLYTVKGACGTLSIVPGTASITNQVFTKFLSRQPHARSDLVNPKTSKEDRMKTALSRLAVMTRDQTIAKRNPRSSLSFCCLSQDVVLSQTNLLKHYQKGKNQAFSPLGPDGKPIRRYSDRKRDHWFHGGKDGLSVAGSYPIERMKLDQEKDRPNSAKSGERDTLTRTPAFGNYSIERNTTRGKDKGCVSSSKFNVYSTTAYNDAE